MPERAASGGSASVPVWKRRLPIVLLGLSFIALGACVAYWGVWESRGGRYGGSPVTVIIGPATRWTAASLAGFGIALLGVLLRRTWAVATWMTVWLCLSVAINFAEPLLCARVDRATSVYR